MGVVAAIMTGCGSGITPILPTGTMSAFPATNQPTIVSTATATPTQEPLELPTAKPTDTPPPTGTPETAWLPGEVRVYPGPEHYEGDLLSFEIVVENVNELGPMDGASLTVDGEAVDFDGANVAYSPLRQHVVVFRWAWDTTGQEGRHEIHVSVPTQAGIPQEETFFVEVLPADLRPVAEDTADWLLVDTECCQIEYISGTAADRDIETIRDRADAAVEHVEEAFETDITDVFPIILLDNIWGNGAFASDYIVLSYVDRAYVSIDLDSVIRHEAVHYATRDMGRNTPVMLVEGIAVYVSGGHYKTEPIPERTAALIELDRYIPLADLTDNFRAHQHEIAYLEAAGLIAYLSETYGWDTFVEMFSLEDIEDGSGSEWLDAAFERMYDRSLNEIEAEFISWLREHDASVQVDDLRLTIDLFDTIRRYQLLYAPYQEDMGPFSDATVMDITSEYMREPRSPENIAIEVALIHAREALAEEDFERAEGLITVLNAVMDSGDFTQQPIGDLLSVTQALDAAGYEAQYIEIDGDSASAMVIREWPMMELLTLDRIDGGWRITGAGG